MKSTDKKETLDHLPLENKIEFPVRSLKAAILKKLIHLINIQASSTLLYVNIYPMRCGWNECY